MNKLLLCMFVFVMVTQGMSQDQIAVRDTSAMPRLEIPEITIVGKKAITLPFARKGEIFDVNIFEAPAPDTSLLGDRPMIALPIGALPRYEEPLVPMHISVEGSLGSFTTGNARGRIDYNTKHWGMYGNTGFQTTQGHANHSSGSSISGEANAHAIIATNDDAIRAFRVAGGLRLMHDSYGMFGYLDTAVDRKRNNFMLNAQLGTGRRDVNQFDIRLSANIWSLTDTRAGIDGEVSSVSPDVEAAFKTTVGDIELATVLSYISSSLDYKMPVQSPSLFKFSVGGRWQMMDQWSIDLGGKYDGGSGSDGESRMIISPYGEVQWELDHDRKLSFWLRPEMTLETYSDKFTSNPYFIREIGIRPERKPINFGSTLWYNAGIISLEVRGSLAKTSNTAIPIADSGKIILDYVDASKLTIRANGIVRLESGMMLSLFGLFQPSYEDGTTTQLPMVPVAQLGARGEFSFHTPITLWSSLEYWSKQNVDRAGSKIIGDHVLMSLGVSTNVIPKTVLSAEVTNLFDTSYEWWSSYRAPGIRIMINARVNLQ